MTAGGRWTGPVTILSLVAVLLVAGCISSPGGGDGDQAKDITLIIDFMGYDTQTYPDQRVEWNLGDGEDWVEVIEERPDGTYYVINDLMSSDALDVLGAGAEATGIHVQNHMETQGAFVDSIDRIENGRDGHYWSYYINDEYGLVSADTAELSDGDTVRWVYMGNPFG